jgi:predicted AlkP superfamily pyrophosphatase or phosphodiesterase
MKNILLILLFLNLGNSSFAQKVAKATKPKLVIGIVVDQMRYDFLYKYQQNYTETGLKLLINNGHNCENTFINYLPSYTGPGHACIYTGSVPSIHGISSNDWIDRQTGKDVYCTSDTTEKNVGGTLKAGKMSPRNLLTTTITDELRLAQHFNNKTIAISLKDRASILPGGHTANAAYWMDDTLGDFMTSTFYINELPAWVTNFNNKQLAKNYLSTDWITILPLNKYTAFANDNNAYEGKFKNETSTAFPHKLNMLKYAEVKKTPFGNTILFDFAKETIVQEKLGKTNYTDFLTVSFSSPDYVGHMYGPNSVEIEDTYVRFDQELSEFLQYLNKEIGVGNYTLFLTADHGAAHNPQFLIDHKIAGGYFAGSVFKKELNNYLNTLYNDTLLVKDVGENFVWYNHKLLKEKNIDRDILTKQIIDFALAKKEIQYATDMLHPNETLMPSILKEMAINGFNYKRSGDILLIFTPAYLDSYSKTGTSHGAWNTYDTHIPLLWYGNGIKKGVTNKTVYMTDIAATLATLLHIQMPNGCIGNCIESVVR